MKPSLKRKVCSTNVIKSCDKEKIHLLQPCNRISIVLTSCLRLLWFSPFMAIEAIYSFLFYLLSFKTARFDSTWGCILKFKIKINARTLTFMVSCQATQTKSRSCFF